MRKKRDMVMKKDMITKKKKRLLIKKSLNRPVPALYYI